MFHRAKKFEILEHPAELRLRIYGKTIEGLFSNAVEVMAQILKRDLKLQIHPNAPKEKIEIKSIDINSLLVDFLSEILAKSQIKKRVYLVSDIKIDALRFTLHASCVGYPVERFDEDIKAVTYQNVNIHQQPTTNNQRPLWQTDLVLDI